MKKWWRFLFEKYNINAKRTAAFVNLKHFNLKHIYFNRMCELNEHIRVYLKWLFNMIFYSHQIFAAFVWSNTIEKTPLFIQQIRALPSIGNTEIAPNNTGWIRSDIITAYFVRSIAHTQTQGERESNRIMGNFRQHNRFRAQICKKIMLNECGADKIVEYLS